MAVQQTKPRVPTCPRCLDGEPVRMRRVESQRWGRFWRCPGCGLEATHVHRPSSDRNGRLRRSRDAD